MRTLVLLLLAGLAAPHVAAAQSYLVVITGLAGEPRYEQAFDTWAGQVVSAARERGGLDDAHIYLLSGRRTPEGELARGRSTREKVERVLSELADRAEPEARIFIVVFGHGSYRDGEARINLPGPDLGANEFAGLLDRFGSRQVVFVNTASASGAFLPVLSGPNRTIVAATKGGFERNETLFGRFFAGALAGDGADVDKDGRISILEAFDYARREVERVYEQENRLLTEHAVLDDNGDGAGSRDPDAAGPDGAVAATLHLSGPAADAYVETSPRLAELHREKAELEERIAELRAAKGEMDPDSYDRQLEALLLELARKARAIREIEGGGR